VVDRGLGQRCATKIRVQDDAGGIDKRVERVSEGAAEFAFDGIGKAGQSEVELGFVEMAGGDLGTEAVENGAGGVGDGGVSFACNQRRELT
jgi:hypothetical protein